MDIIKIGKKKVGAGHPTFFVAELSGNHNQDFNLAMKTIRAMKKAGADAVKFQTYTADTITIDSRKKYFLINDGSVWSGKNLHDLYSEAYTPWNWQPRLKKYAQKLGMLCFSSPFDPTSVDFLEKMDVPAYKVASYEITDIPLIKNIAGRGKPVIFSTGVATLSDIKEAVKVCRGAGNNQIALLQCVSAYPAPFEEMNLRTIPDMEKEFKVVAGISDHTIGSSVSIAAVALGAKIVEKHFILDRRLTGPDSTFSVAPDEFRQMVDDIRSVEKALGKADYELTPSSKIARWNIRSLFVVENVKKGEEFSEKNVRSIRPGYGLAPKYLSEVIGKKATKDIKKGTPLDRKMIGL